MRYVVLYHTGWIEDHFDLMLETNAHAPLHTWRLDAFPVPGRIILLPDHRREYLTYEGPVSHNRGHVRRVSAGEYHIEHESAEYLSVFFSAVGCCIRLPLS
jgi:hypothetical protein